MQKGIIMFCPKCGNEIQGDIKFCSKCGTALHGDEKTSAPRKIPMGGIIGIAAGGGWQQSLPGLTRTAGSEPKSTYQGGRFSGIGQCQMLIKIKVDEKAARVHFCRILSD